MENAVKLKVKRQLIGEHHKRVISKSILTIIMYIIGIFMILPFLWMLSTSFKLMKDVNIFPVQWITPTMNLNNYKEVLFNQNPPFYLYFLNTVKITVITVIGSVITSAFAGYAFARLQFKGRDIIFLLYLITMMIPFQVLMVPQFMLFKWFGLYNNHWSLILPRIFTPLGTFLMRQYFMSVPYELNEAARIDGAGEFKTFKDIILPLAAPAVATLTILTFVWRWNEYEAPLVFLSSRKLFTLTLGLTNFIDESGVQQTTLIMAASVIALLPMVIVFLFGQKYFIEGITAGSVKG